MKICKECGASQADSAKFCMECGNTFPSEGIKVVNEADNIKNLYNSLLDLFNKLNDSSCDSLASYLKCKEVYDSSLNSVKLLINNEWGNIYTYCEIINKNNTNNNSNNMSYVASLSLLFNECINSLEKSLNILFEHICK